MSENDQPMVFEQLAEPLFRSGCVLDMDRHRHRGVATVQSEM